MKINPVADVLPVMPEADFQQLKANIAARGLLEPIWVDDSGAVLDGRHRARACEELGISPRFRMYAGTQSQTALVEFVLSMNYYRRHLNESQRAIAAARARKYYPGSDKQLVDKVADNFNVGRTTVYAAIAVLEQGDPKLIKAIDEGNAKVNHAFNLLDLPKDEQAKVAESGAKVIRQAAEAAKWRKRIGKIVDEGTPSMECGGAKFALVYADPPWMYQHPVSESRDIENHYPTMALEEIRKLPVKNVLTESAMLFLWAPAAKVAEAITVMEAWGFDYRSMAVWVKPSIGPGYYFRTQHECLLVGAHGAPITPLPENRTSSVIYADRREHSQKPDEVYALLEGMYPDVPKIELFARNARAGWVSWGFEAKKEATE